MVRKIFLLLMLVFGLTSYGQMIPIPDCNLATKDVGDFESQWSGTSIGATILGTYAFKTREMPNQDFDFCSLRLEDSDRMFNDPFVISYPIILNDLTEKVSVARNTFAPLGLNLPEPILITYDVSRPLVFSGLQSIRLNNAGSTGNGSVTSLERKCAFVPTDDVLTYNFRLIMENGHDTPDALEKQPTFTVNILNEDDEVISQSCIVATLDDPIFQLAQKPGKKDIVYTDWLCGAIKIPHDYVTEEKKITYEFIISDCRAVEHFGVVYLDDIGIGMNCEPDFGWLDLDLDDILVDCPAGPFQVCGSYIAPQNANLTNIELDIIDVNTNNSVLTTLIDNAVIDSANQTFCFTVDLVNLGIAAGEYKFKAHADFTTTVTGSSYVYNLEAESSNQVDLTTLDCCENGTFDFDYNIENYILTWDDFGGPYTLEFRTDMACCGGSGSNGMYETITTTDNFFNINDVVNLVKDRCYRWRIQTPCGWSEWCCIYTAYADGGMSLGIPCLEEYDNSMTTNVYPNPTTGMLNIEGVENGATIEIYDFNMNKVYDDVLHEKTININHLPDGNYVLLINGNQRINIVKQ